MICIDLVFVDSHLDQGGWRDHEELRSSDLPDTHVRVRGFLVFEDQDCYVVAVGHTTKASIGRLLVPKAAVTWRQLGPELAAE